MLCVSLPIYREARKFNQNRAQHQRRQGGPLCSGDGGYPKQHWLMPRRPRHFNSGHLSHCWGWRYRSSATGTPAPSTSSPAQEEASAGGWSVETPTWLPGGLWAWGPGHLLHGMFSGPARIQGEQLPLPHSGVSPRDHVSEPARKRGHGCRLDQRLFKWRHKNSWWWDDLSLGYFVKLIC